jgi:zinc protease
VIISEREGNENNPLFLLDENVQSASFDKHPYRHEVIGEMADLQSMTREDLFQHYQSYYRPSNGVLAIAGDFETKKMIERIRELFEPIPGGEIPMRVAGEEEPLTEERQVLAKGPGQTIFVKATYRAPRATDPDFFALTVVDSLLAGPSNLNLFGGGISNKTSRLYRRLVENDLAVGVSGGLQATIDPFLYALTITVHPQRKADDVLGPLEEEITRLQDSLPKEDELARAVKQAEALFAYGSESITNQAFWLGFAEIFDHYEWFLNYLDRLRAVTPKEVQAAAQRYLRRDQRVLGVYQPEGAA